MGYRLLQHYDPSTQTCHAAITPKQKALAVAADQWVRIHLTDVQITSCTTLSATVSLYNGAVSTSDTTNVAARSAFTPGYGSVNVHCGAVTCGNAPGRELVDEVTTTKPPPKPVVDDSDDDAASTASAALV